MKIRDGFEAFRRQAFPQHAELFELLEKGQKPEVLFVTCSDSRIDPALITQTVPGELFVIRNAGNFVPTREGSGVAATLEYGVRALGVKHIVVCGHSHCGAVAAALQPESVTSLPYVASWLKEAGPDLSGVDAGSMTEAVERNVKNQLDNLRALPFVAEAVEQGTLELHGWVYKFETGEIFEHTAGDDRFVALGDGDSTRAEIAQG